MRRLSPSSWLVPGLCRDDHSWRLGATMTGTAASVPPAA